MRKYLKAGAAIVSAVVSAVVAAATDGHVTAHEWVNVAVLGVGAAAVLAAPNVPGAKYTKAVLAVLSAVLTLLASLITNGLTWPEVGQLVVAGLGAVGVWAVPNRASAAAHAVEAR